LNGDGLQSTTRGLMVWRKSDNWTAFTDGFRTWINGPSGVQERLNTQRFPWEHDGVQPVAFRSPSDSWLGRINYYRSLARVSPVAENGSLDAAATNHARYMVANGVVTHSEDPSNPRYTGSGAAAGEASDVSGFSWSVGDAQAIDTWMAAPFHAVAILDPGLRQVGYGSFHGGGPVSTGTDLYFGAGRGAAGGASFPVMWPSDGSTISLHQVTSNEFPDPLSSCPGYGTSAGLPLLLLLGPGVGARVGDHALTQNGRGVESCVVDAAGYVNSNASLQGLGRAILGEYGTIVIIPRQPLAAGSLYTVSVTADGHTYTWSFHVS
jgi:hypothetical protein